MAWHAPHKALCIGMAASALRARRSRDIDVDHRNLARVLIARPQGGRFLKIMLYGQLGEKLGSEVDLDLPSGTDTVARLRTVLAKQFPEATGEFLQLTRACVADMIVGDDYPLAGAQVVEFFPPLSGG